MHLTAPCTVLNKLFVPFRDTKPKTATLHETKRIDVKKHGDHTVEPPTVR